MKAMQTERQYPMEVWSEARWYADRVDAPYEDLPHIEEMVAHRLFMRDTERLRHLKVQLVLHCVPTFGAVLVDGKPVQIEPFPFSPEVADTLARIDEMIDEEAKRYGLSFSVKTLDKHSNALLGSPQT